MSNVFFIVGTGRCGTQMLRNVLNCWPNVVILPETHFIISLYDKYGLQEITVNNFLEVVDNIRGASGDKWAKVILNSSLRDYQSYKKEFIDYTSLNHVKGNIRVFLDKFYEFLYGKGKVFGDKTPHYGTNLSIIKKIWPEAKIIHLIRDGVDCAHSMQGHPGFIRYINENVAPRDLDRIMYKRSPQVSESIRPKMEPSLAFWRNVINVTQQELNAIPPKDVLEVKYENIVFHPISEISHISLFLGIHDDASSLNKAMCIPRPFPEKHQVKKLNDQEYQKYKCLISNEMDFYGYPYSTNIERDFKGVIKELYRGRYSYVSHYKKKLKNLVKSMLGR